VDTPLSKTTRVIAAVVLLLVEVAAAWLLWWLMGPTTRWMWAVLWLLFVFLQWLIIPLGALIAAFASVYVESRTVTTN